MLIIEYGKRRSSRETRVTKSHGARRSRCRKKLLGKQIKGATHRVTAVADMSLGNKVFFSRKPTEIRIVKCAWGLPTSVSSVPRAK